MADPITTADVGKIVTDAIARGGGERAPVYTPEETVAMAQYNAQPLAQTLEADVPGITTKTYATMQEDPLYSQLNTLAQQGGGYDKYTRIDAITDILAAKYPGSGIKELVRRNVTSNSGVTAADIARDTYGSAYTSQKAAVGDTTAAAAISSGAWQPGTEKAAVAAAEIGISPVVSSNPAINSNPVVNISKVYDIGDMSPKSGEIWSGTGWTGVQNVPGAQVAMVRAGFNPLASSLGESYYNVMTNSINEKAGRYYGNELQKSVQNYVELSSAYHNWAKDTGLPTAPNPYEYAGDLALGILKGTNQSSKSSVYGENITDYSTLNLPGGFGIQDVAWNSAIGYDRGSGWKADYSGYDTAIAKLQSAVANKEMGVYGNIPAPTSTQAGGETRKLSLGEQQAIGIAASGLSYAPEDLRNPYVNTGTLLGFGAAGNTQIAQEAANNLYASPKTQGFGSSYIDTVAPSVRSAVASPLEELGDTGLYMLPGTLAKVTTPTSVELTKSYSYDLPILGTVATGETALGIHNFLTSSPVISAIGTPLLNFERTDSIINIIGQPVKETVTLNAPDTKSAGADYTGRFLNEYTGALEPIGTSKEFLNYPITTDIKVGESAFGKGSRYVSEVSQYILPSVSSLSPAAETLAQKGDVLKYVPVMGLALSGASKIPAIGFGAYTGIREKPVETGINVGVGIALGGIFDAALGVSGYAIGTTAEGTTARKVTSTLGSAFNVGTKYVLPGLYAADVGIRSEGSYTKLGGILGTETGPMIVGGGIYSGLKGGTGSLYESAANRIFSSRQKVAGITKLEPGAGWKNMYGETGGTAANNIPTINIERGVPSEYSRGGAIGKFLDTTPSGWFKPAGKTASLNAQIATLQRLPASDAARYADLEMMFGQSRPLLEATTSKALIVPSNMLLSGRTLTDTTVGPAGTRISQVSPSGRVGVLGFDVGANVKTFEGYTTGPRSQQKIERSENIFINPYSGEATVIGKRFATYTPPKPGAPEFEFYRGKMNIYNLPVFEATTGVGIPKISDVSSASFRKGLFEFGAIKEKGYAGKVYQKAYLYDIHGEEIVGTRILKQTTESSRAIEDILRSNAPEKLGVSSYAISKSPSVGKVSTASVFRPTIPVGKSLQELTGTYIPPVRTVKSGATVEPVTSGEQRMAPLQFKSVTPEEMRSTLIQSMFSEFAPRTQKKAVSAAGRTKYLASSKKQVERENKIKFAEADQRMNRLTYEIPSEPLIDTTQSRRISNAMFKVARKQAPLISLVSAGIVGEALSTKKAMTPVSGKAKYYETSVLSIPETRTLDTLFERDVNSLDDVARRPESEIRPASGTGLKSAIIPISTIASKTAQITKPDQITRPAQITIPGRIVYPGTSLPPETRTTTKPKPPETKIPVIPMLGSWVPGGGTGHSMGGKGRKYREVWGYSEFSWQKSTNVGAAKPQKAKPSTSKPSIGMSLPKMGEGLMGPQKSVVQISNPSRALKSSIPKSLMSPPSQPIGKSSTVIAKKKKGKK